MTTIAYVDGIIAADRSAWSSDMRSGQVTKIARSKKGHLFGSSGGCLWGQRMQAWVRDGAKEKKMPQGEEESSGVLIMPDRQVFIVETNGLVFMETDRIALGSGREGAMGALYAGAKAFDAIKIAAILDPWTGSGIDWLSQCGQGGRMAVGSPT